jgi:hypothetical protein
LRHPVYCAFAPWDTASFIIFNGSKPLSYNIIAQWSKPRVRRLIDKPKKAMSTYLTVLWNLHMQEVLYLTNTGNFYFWILLPGRERYFLGLLSCIYSWIRHESYFRNQRCPWGALESI